MFAPIKKYNLKQSLQLFVVHKINLELLFKYHQKLVSIKKLLIIKNSPRRIKDFVYSVI